LKSRSYSQAVSPQGKPGHSNAPVVFSSNHRSNLTAAWQICGNISAIPWQPRRPSPSRIRREKAGACRMKKARRSFAFGSSQRNRMTLMFGADRSWRPGLSASRSFGFRITPRGMRAAPRRLMRRKSFKQR
jgi:hypothetical protein